MPAQSHFQSRFKAQSESQSFSAASFGKKPGGAIFVRWQELLLCLFALLLLASPDLHAAEKQASEASQAREGILLVAFGSSLPETTATFKAIESDFRKAFPDQPLVWAFTSQIIRKKLAREGRPVGSISEGLDKLAKEGVRVVRVQSLHVMAGEEFSALERAVLLNVKAHPGRFEAVYLGRPLLEGQGDAASVREAVLKAAKRKPGVLLGLMAHGQAKDRAGLAFEGVRASFREADPLAYLATVEGTRSFEKLLPELKAQKGRQILLMPLMIVAGDHARNDLAGSEADSWASRLKAEGFSVESQLSGLGELAEIRALFVRHARESADDLVKEPRKP